MKRETKIASKHRVEEKREVKSAVYRLQRTVTRFRARSRGSQSVLNTWQQRHVVCAVSCLSWLQRSLRSRVGNQQQLLSNHRVRTLSRYFSRSLLVRNLRLGHCFPREPRRRGRSVPTPHRSHTPSWWTALTIQHVLCIFAGTVGCGGCQLPARLSEVPGDDLKGRLSSDYSNSSSEDAIC